MKSKKFPLVAIVVVNWNGGQKIIDCLTTLKKTKYPNYKVILVDNNSTNDSIIKLIKIQPHMSVLKLDDNYGYTIGTNVGWKYGLNKLGADYICAMDSDIVTVDPLWLDKVINELEKKNKRGIACAKLVFPDNRVQMLFYERYRPNYQEQDRGQYDFIREVKAVGGACIVIKKKVIKTIGYYDENFFYGPNDLDYCFRAQKKGFKVVYVGIAKVVHIGSASYLASDRTKIYLPQSMGNMLFYLRHFSRIQSFKMMIRQAIRICITKKDPYNSLTWHNIFFHIDMLKRAKIYMHAIYEAIINYRHVKNDGPRNKPIIEKK